MPYDWENDLYDWEADLEPAATGTSGGPIGPRRRNTPAQRRDEQMRDWQRQPWYTRATMAPDELQPGGVEARTKAAADAGAVVSNLLADSTINLPANVSGFLGKVAGQIGRNFDPSIDPATWRENTTPWSIRTQRGDEVMGEAFAPVAEAVERVGTKYPLLGAAAETVGTAAEGLGYFLGGRAAAPAVSRLMEPAPPKPHQLAPVAEVAHRYTIVPDDAAQSAGLLPSEVTGSARASLGRTVTDTETPIKNVKDATRRVVEDMPQRNLVDANGRVDEGLLEGAIRREAVPYGQIKTLPTPTANTLAGRLRQAWETRGGSLKGDAVAESRLAPLMDMEAAPLSAGELLLRWREINDYASQLRKAAGEGAPAAQIKGRDLRAIAEAILDEIDDRATAFGTPELVDNLKAARVNIARLHTLGDSLDNAGWVDPTKLVAMAERSEPLTGALAQLAADAKAAPRSLAPLKRAVDASGGNELDQFGRQPNSWLRNVAGHLGGNMLARRGVESLNRELRAGSGLLRQPVPETPVPPLWPPNSGPAPLFGPPAPPAPNYGPLGLSVEGAPDPRFARFAQGGDRQAANPADVVDWELPFQIGETLPPLGPQGRFAGPAVTDMATGAVEPGVPGEALLSGDIVSRRARNLGGTVGQSSFADQLGPVRSEPGIADFEMGNIDPNPMPDRPRGVAGPRSAQLSDPAVPSGFELLLDDTPPPLGPRFGPGDEFPGGGAAPAAPVAPAGDFAEMLYRGVQEGADPFAPNERNFTTWSNRRPTAERYGPVVGETPFDEAANVHLGTLEDARRLLGLPPAATAQDIAEAAMRRFAGENRTASYDLPPELDGTPREFIRFGEQAPAAPRFAEAADILRRFDDQDGGANPWMADTELLDELDALPDEALPPGVRDRIEQFRERRREDYDEDAGRGDSDEDLEAAIAEIRRLLGQ